MKSYEIRLYNSLTKAELMEHILNVRLTSLEEERLLCSRLLKLAESEMDIYSSAFAYVYLLDSCVALGDFENCGFYTARASFLCHEYKYDELLLNLCNFAGLYYWKLKDEQTALDYYLEGLVLARELKAAKMEGKILNNIGTCFGGQGDWETAKEYYQNSIEVMGFDEEDPDHTISSLCNLAEACQNTGEIENTKVILKQCEDLENGSIYQKFRICSGWCNYYAGRKDKENCIKLVDSILDLGLLAYEQRYFVYDRCIELFECMMEIGAREKSEFFLNALEALTDKTDVMTEYRVQNLKIRYLEQYGLNESLKGAYKDYYALFLNVEELEAKSAAQSLISKLQLTDVLVERELVKKKNQELEDIGLKDELTGLYNRRYFNKLLTKAVSDQEIFSCGIVMLDLDYFKQYNDCYGHLSGDSVLCIVADIMRQWAAKDMFPCRYGGDEFICLCFNKKDDILHTYVSNVMDTLKNRNIPHKYTPVQSADRLTVSVGYCNEPISMGVGPLMALADRALYEVKKEERGSSLFKRRT